MLVYLDNPVGVEFCSYVKTFFSSNKLYSIDADHVSENVLQALKVVIGNKRFRKSFKRKNWRGKNMTFRR